MIRITLFTLAGFLVAGGVFVASERIAPVYAHEKKQMRLIETHRHTIQAITVGNSHNAAIDFDTLGLRGMHFHRAGTDVFEASYTARMLADELPSLKVVFLPVSYSWMYGNNGIVPEHAWRRARVYGAPWAGWPMKGDLEHFFAGKMAPLVRPDRGRELFTSLLQAAGRTGLVDRFRTSRRGAAAEIPSEAALNVDGPRRARLHLDLADRTVLLDPDAGRRAEEELVRLAAFLAGRNVALILFTPPYHRSYVDAYRAQNILESQRAIARVLRHPNVRYVDASTTALGSPAGSPFANSDHLNPAGAAEFSRSIRQLVDPVDGARTVAVRSFAQDQRSRSRD